MERGITDQVTVGAEVRLAKYTRALAFYTLLLTLATMASMAFTAWISLSTRDLRDLALRQAEDTQKLLALTQQSVTATSKQADASVILAETAKRQAEQIQRQVDAALEQNRLSLMAIQASSEASRKQNQAYGYFLPYTTNRVPMDGEIYVDTNAVGHFQNVGSTPMMNVHVWSISGLVDYPFRNNVEPELMDDTSIRNMAKFSSENSVWEGGITIGPGKIHVWPINLVHHPLNEDEIAAYHQGNKVFYIEAVIFYKDTYGARHKDKDCVYFQSEFYFKQWGACFQRREKL